MLEVAQVLYIYSHNTTTEYEKKEKVFNVYLFEISNALFSRKCL